MLDAGTALDLAGRVAAGWAEGTGAEADPVYDRLVGLPPTSAAQGAPLPTRFSKAETWLRILRGDGIKTLPPGTVYLHVSHLRLERPERFDWLYGRPDIRAVFTIHDLIPITHPEYCRPGEAARHAARIETVARHAAHILADTQEIAARLRDHLAARGLPPRPITAAHLGIEPAFSARAGSAAALDRPTFLACGTIEPRKNHLLLLTVWRRLAERLGANTPRLILVGNRGWEAENTVTMLDRCPGLRGHVEEVVGLTTPGLGRLMRSATALLMPSFSEGYGLPVMEAAASGLPVVASDIAVHREVAGSFAHFLHPTDGLGWMKAVDALAAPGSALRAELTGRLSSYVAPSWDVHFERVEAVLAQP